jgi:hypothetical protein
MAVCTYCGSKILFGGKKDGDRRFCNDMCYNKNICMDYTKKIPQNVVTKYIKTIHDGNCPKCNGPGPVDIFMSYRVWSVIFLTKWTDIPQKCCHRCAIKSNIGNGLFSLFFGWWGFPAGIIVTPIQIIRNIIAIFKIPDPSKPSKKLETMLLLEMGAKVMEEKQKEKNLHDSNLPPLLPGDPGFNP